MKRVILCALFLMLTITLMGCQTSKTTRGEGETTFEEPTSTEPETRIDRTKPTINISENIITISVNQEVDLLEGVQAFDNVDGNLTQQITLNEGTFNNTIPGEYIISYRVTDKKGNVGVATKKIIVLNPQLVFDTDTEVFNINGYRMTKGEVYTQLKTKYGLETLLDMIDRDLLIRYKDMVRWNGEFHPSEYFQMVKRYGVVRGSDETEEAFNERVKDRVLLDYLRYLPAVEEYKKNINQSIRTDLMNKYQEDACVMVLEYYNLETANEVLSLLGSFQGNDVLTQFETLWNNQQGYNKNNGFEIVQTPYLDSLLTCNYMKLSDERFQYSPYMQIKDLAYGIENNTYNTSPYQLNNGYYIIYKVSQAPKKETYDQAKFLDDLLSQYAFKYMNYDETQKRMPELREKANLRIYDQELYDQYYQVLGEDVQQKDYVIATYNGKTITQNEFYNELKKRNFVYEQLGYINKELLELEGYTVLDTQVSAELKNTYYDSYTKKYHIHDNRTGGYIILTAEEATEFLRGRLAEKKYVLDNDPIDFTQITEQYYHLGIHSIIIPEGQKNIDIVLEQLLNGVKDNETAYVLYDGRPFKGFNNVEVTARVEAFYNLQILDINNYTNYNEVSNTYHNSTVYDQMYRNLYNWGTGSIEYVFVNNHLAFFLAGEIYQMPEKPADYDTLTEQEIQLKVTEYNRTGKSEYVPYVNYYYFIQPLKKRYEDMKLSPSNVEKHLAELRNKHEFKFNDEELQDIYEYFNQYYPNYNDGYMN